MKTRKQDSEKACTRSRDQGERSPGPPSAAASRGNRTEVRMSRPDTAGPNWHENEL